MSVSTVKLLFNILHGTVLTFQVAYLSDRLLVFYQAHVNRLLSLECCKYMVHFYSQVYDRLLHILRKQHVRTEISYPFKGFIIQDTN